MERLAPQAILGRRQQRYLVWDLPNGAAGVSEEGEAGGLGADVCQ